MAAPYRTTHVGLSPAQARERLERDGPNELPRQRQRTVFRIILEVLREPMLAMLLAAGFIYLLLGDRTEAIVLILFAAASVLITVVQESRTEHALEALRDLSAPRALVIRGGETVRIPGREVVRDDLLMLEQGDRIAADAVVIESVDLEADEALLTGESVPVRKRPALPQEALVGRPGGDDLARVFAGSIVTRGSGLARVQATGARSEMGQIGRSLASLNPEKSGLKRETVRMVRLCAAAGVSVAALAVVLHGLRYGDWLAALLAGIAAAMSLMPEEIPVVLTTFLAMGAWRISKVGVLTRRSAAIETLGAATILCTDKTGTLTQNRMTVAELWLPPGEYVDLSKDPIAAPHQALLEASALASAPVPVDPMEIAIHAAARNAGVAASPDRQLTLSHGLRPDLLAMSNVWQLPGEVSRLVAAKGAPEAIARLCRIDGVALRDLEAATRTMAQRGRRVLGVATAMVPQSDAHRAHEEHHFELLGIVGLIDPLRGGVTEAVGECRSAGIRVVMITGDYAATAKAVAIEAGIADGDVVTGSELAGLSDEHLAERIGRITVFARTMPEQKLRIVNAYKAAGEIVAMTGDGVNDAPALKAAHIGVAMGKRGSDVAREAATIVLLEDDFEAIVGSIKVGRRISDNIRKALAFIFAVHVPIAGMAVLPLAVGLPLVLGPIQIALLELVIDPVCALVFEAEREESRIMQRPPRNPHHHLFSKQLVIGALVQGALALAMVCALYLATLASGAPDGVLRTVSFLALLGAVLALIFANRSFNPSLRHAVLRRNITLRFVLAFVAAGIALILTSPPVQRILKLDPLAPLQVGLLALSGATLLIVLQLVKHGRDRTA
jgi:Ca2+-transporting ATPase